MGTWLGFASLVLVLAVLHVGVLWRALGREEESVTREVRAAVQKNARALETRLAADFDAAERALEQGAAVPPFAVPMRRSDDGTALLAGLPAQRTATSSSACEWIGIDYGRTPRAERPARIATILRDCPLARGASGGLLVPAMHDAHEIAEAEWNGWHEAHQDSPDAVAVRRLESVISALSQRAERHESGTLRVDLPEGRIRVRREVDGYGGWLVTPASLVRSIAPLHDDDLVLTLAEHSAATFRETVVAGPFALQLSLDNPAVVGARSAKSRAVVLSLSLASLALALGTAFVLMRRMARLRRENELRVDFVAAVSHELRTPLASIRLLSDLLRREDLPAADRAEAFASLDASTTRLAAQTERWLTLARLGKERVAARCEEGDLAAVVRTAAARVASARVVAVDVEAPAQMPFSFDPFLVQVIVENLLENAVKYGAPPFGLALEPSAAGARLICTDQGPGFPADAARLLRPFERGDVRLHHATEGVGLGLSLVQGAARAHGGDVALESRDRGARVVVILAIR